MIGHGLSAAGSIESVAAVLQLNDDFIFPSINSEDLHPEIAKLIDNECVPNSIINKELNVVVKASFGFGDVNSCLVFAKFRS